MLLKSRPQIDEVLAISDPFEIQIAVGSHLRSLSRPLLEDQLIDSFPRLGAYHREHLLASITAGVPAESPTEAIRAVLSDDELVERVLHFLRLNPRAIAQLSPPIVLQVVRSADWTEDSADYSRLRGILLAAAGAVVVAAGVFVGMMLHRSDDVAQPAAQIGFAVTPKTPVVRRHAASRAIPKVRKKPVLTAKPVHASVHHPLARRALHKQSAVRSRKPLYHHRLAARSGVPRSHRARTHPAVFAMTPRGSTTVRLAMEEQTP
ncbi:MAG: hypothetical protein ABI182_07075, partial [Candidatus Baltobacteraceae bacterium]